MAMCKGIGERKGAPLIVTDNEMMENKNVNTKIKTFERLFRSLKYRQDENQVYQKTVIEEEFCKDVRKILEEMEQIRNNDWQIGIQEQKDRLGQKITAGQYIVLAGPIGIGGTVLMAKFFQEELRKVFPAWLIRDALGMEPLQHLYPTRELLEKYDVSAVYSVGEGGIWRTLYQLGKDAGRGFEIQARRILVNQITIELCEHFDLNPWNLLSCGCTLMICAKPMGLLQELKLHNIQSEIIGFMTENKDKIITYGSTRSLLNRPKTDALLTKWLDRV